MAPGVAARVAGWQRRLGGQAGPLGPVSAGPTGDSPNGAVLQVEIPIDGVWTDVTSRVMTRDGSGGIAITRGRPNEASATNPSTCSLQLNNRDGLFSPRNPLSPFYGKAGRNTQIRVSVPSGGTKSYRFWGEFSELPQQWDTTGSDVWVDLQASGILRRIGQGASPLGSTMRIALTSPLTNPVVAYWPCEDLSGSTSIASALPAAQAMAIAGAPQLASFSGFVCSAGLPTMGTGRFTGTVPTYTPAVSTMVRFLLALPTAALTVGQVLLSFATNGTIRTWEVYYVDTQGLISLRGRDAFGNIVQDLGDGASLFLNGATTQVSVELVQNGTEVDYTLVTASPDGTTTLNVPGIAASSSVGLVTSVTVAPNQDLTSVTFGHIRVQTSTTNLAGFNNDDFSLLSQYLAYVGETAADRIARLCGSASIVHEQIGAASTAVAMGTQLSASLPTLIQDCANADMGILYELTDGLGLGYRTRASMENQVPALALSYSAANLADPLKPTDDDQYTRNDITVTRTNGGSARAALSTGALSILPPPAGVGPYPDAVTININVDSGLADQAGWRLHMGTVDEARHPTISVNLAHNSFATNPTLLQQALAVGPGDRITISNPPAWLPPDLISQIVVGFSETIDQFQHRITYNCVPESPFRTALLEDLLLGRIDTDGSQLAADALATDTTLSVATTSGPTWTTTDVPFDIRIAGEQITVTGVSGSVSPQQFAVTRGVNGVTKPQLYGADVRLNQPMILAL